VFSRRGQQGKEDDGQHDDIKRLEAKIEELKRDIRKANERTIGCVKILEAYYHRCNKTGCPYWIKAGVMKSKKKVKE
jgi:hypothetical protein